MEEDGWFSAEVWQKDDPSVRGVYTQQMPAGLSWRFHHWIHTGTAWMDNYRERRDLGVRYAYDPLGNLTDVWDAPGNHTSMVYDALGHKTTMHDPDMGDWSYAYDDVGNLLLQTDNRGCVTDFDYDPLHRLTDKTYNGTACNGTPGVSYTYDQGTNGIGRRTRMDDGSGYTTWVYDVRGRVTREDRTITGGGTFVTEYTYDALDRVETTTYPDGEVVRATYGSQGLPTRLHSDTYGLDYAGQGSDVAYNALGQVVALPLGNGLTTNYTYDPLMSRLTRTQTGALLDLRYAYDPVGNVHSIYDTTRSETLRFAYDALDRLASFETRSGNHNEVLIRAKGSWAEGWPLMQLRVNGVVVQQWEVDTTSWTDYVSSAPLTGEDQIDVVFPNDYASSPNDRNLYVDYFVVDGQTIQAESSEVQLDRGAGEAAFDGIDVIPGQEGIYWSGALRTHVSSAASWTAQRQYAYDATGNVLSKTGTGRYGYHDAAHAHAVTHLDGVQRYWYDENGNMTTRDEGGGTYQQSFDAESRLISVTKDAGVSEFIYDGDGNRAKRTILDQNLAAGVWATSSGTLYWPEVVTDGDTWADSGSASSGEFAYTSQIGLQYVQLDLGAAYTVDEVKVWHYAADGRTYHNTKTEVSADGVDWDTVFDSAVSGEYAETAAGKTHSFSPRAVRYVRDYVNGSTANAGNHWVEIEVRGSRTTVYAGGHYELEVESSAVTKHYYLAVRRVAVRANGVVYWLHGDHLGSTSLTTTDSGALHSEQRYYPYGEVRWSNGTLPTDHRFTGQRDESVVKLYDYKARFYDPYLARFLSPDTLVPDPAKSMEFNRYGYCLANPVNYIDPTGHQVRFSHWDSIISSSALGGGGSGLSAYARVPVNPTTSSGPGYVLTLQQETSMGRNPELSWYNVAEWGGNLWGHISNVGNWLFGPGNPPLGELISSAINARSSLGDVEDHTVAVTEDGTRVHSGWRNRSAEGFAGGREATDQVLQLSREMGYDLRHYPKRDHGVPGQYYASHAETQMSVVAPDQSMAISHPRGICPDCVNYFRRLSAYRGMPQVIADPNGVNLFTNGMHEYLSNDRLPGLLR